jgi:hypothetical protein
VREAEKFPPGENRVQEQDASSSDAVITSPACTSLTPDAPLKKPRISVFSSYNRSTSTVSVQTAPLRCTVQAYLDLASASPNITVKAILSNEQFKPLGRFLSSLYCVPATSAPVERIFSHSGIFMRPNRARMADDVLCKLVFAKCNAHL